MLQSLRTQETIRGFHWFVVSWVVGRTLGVVDDTCPVIEKYHRYGFSAYYRCAITRIKGRSADDDCRTENRYRATKNFAESGDGDVGNRGRPLFS